MTCFNTTQQTLQMMEIERLEAEVLQLRSFVDELIKDKLSWLKQINALSIPYVAPVDDIAKHVSTLASLHTRAEVTMLAVQVQNSTIQNVLEIIEDTET